MNNYSSSPFLLLFTRTTNFWIGLWTMDGWLQRSPCFPNCRSPTFTATFCTSPSSSSHASTTLASFHSLRGTSSSLMITISPTSTLRLGACHRCRRAMFERYSFLYLCQNCLDRYWTLLHHFLVYRSSLMNFHGGGSGTEDFIVIKWFGVSGSKLVGSLMLSTVRGREVIYNGHSFIKVLKEVLSNLPTLLARTVLSTLFTVLIWRSQMPPVWLECGVFIWKSHWLSARYVATLSLLSSFRAFAISFFAPAKLVPWSDLMWVTLYNNDHY